MRIVVQAGLSAGPGQLVRHRIWLALLVLMDALVRQEIIAW